MTPFSCPKIPSVLLLAALVTSTGFAANPLNFGSNIKTADPSGHVWADGRMYVYASHDEECQEDFWMKDWHAFSSADLVNWTDHGAILSVKDLKWADNYAWAPDAAYKNGKYYFIFPAGNGHKDRVNPGKSTKWMGIGIAESDSPTGPFKDMIGAPLWTKPYANDPCLFVDDDAKAYLYVPPRGNEWMVAEMADDMRSVKAFHKMDMGGYQPKMEGPWVFKRNGIYYYTMPENNRTLTYYTSSSRSARGNTRVSSWTRSTRATTTTRSCSSRGSGSCSTTAGCSPPAATSGSGRSAPSICISTPTARSRRSSGPTPVSGR